MAKEVTADQLIEAARDLGKDQFYRDDLAEKLEVQKSDLADSLKQARQEGRLEKVGEDENGYGLFALTS